MRPSGPSARERSPALIAKLVVSVVAIAGVTRALFACVDLESLKNGPPRDGAAPGDETVTTEGGPALPDPCEHVRPIDPPARDDESDGSVPPFVMAIDEALLDTKRAAGYDLDGVCTCDKRPGVPNDGGSTCLARSTVCDLDGGIDNMVGTVAAASSPTVSLATLPNRLVQGGQRTVLLQLGNYNGMANDTDVSIGAVLAEGIRTPPTDCDASVYQDASDRWTPGKCGTDTWTISSASVIKSGQLLPLVVGLGYVNDHHLVVRLKAPVTVPFTVESAVSIEEPTLTATIVPLGADMQPRDAAAPPGPGEARFFRLENGIIAGRVALPNVLASLGSYRQGGPAGVRVCANESVFDLVRTQICANADLTRDPTAPPTTTCDALSMAMGFTAIPALAGTVVDSPPPVPAAECDPDGGAYICR